MIAIIRDVYPDKPCNEDIHMIHIHTQQMYQSSIIVTADNWEHGVYVYSSVFVSDNQCVMQEEFEIGTDGQRPCFLNNNFTVDNGNSINYEN